MPALSIEGARKRKIANRIFSTAGDRRALIGEPRRVRRRSNEIVLDFLNHLPRNSLDQMKLARCKNRVPGWNFARHREQILWFITWGAFERLFLRNALTAATIPFAPRFNKFSATKAVPRLLGVCAPRRR
jgi:hypothetical protein